MALGQLIFIENEEDPNAFLFSLINKDKQLIKMKVNNNGTNAICCHSDYGLTFFGDIFICNNANTANGSISNLGQSYTHPQYAYNSIEAKSFLAGSYTFQIDEIEVYAKI